MSLSSRSAISCASQAEADSQLESDNKTSETTVAVYYISVCMYHTLPVYLSKPKNLIDASTHPLIIGGMHIMAVYNHNNCIEELLIIYNY